MDENLTKSEIICAFEKVLPYLPFLFDDDISVALTDTEKFTQNLTCESLPLAADPGTLIPEGGAAKKAISSGKVLVKEVPKEVYGAPFKSYAVPIKEENGEVAGCLLVARNLNRSKKLLGVAKDLSESFGHITEAVNEMSEDIQKLAQMNYDIAEKSEKATENTEGTGEVLKFIQEIAFHTNLLGINASIEAARVGEAGRGFQVVAEEIRKMSTNTSDSIKKINTIIQDIEESINNITSGIRESNLIFHGQVAILEEITASMSELNTTAKALEQLSEQI